MRIDRTIFVFGNGWKICVTTDRHVTGAWAVKGNKCVACNDGKPATDDEIAAFAYLFSWRRK